MLALYPSIQPYNHFFLDVGNNHCIYVEEVGNPQGTPVLFVHGGPGSGISPDNRRLFDPLHYRIILFDQRGCGKSTPHIGLTANTTEHLIADMEAIRRKLGINAWVIYGGSWGTTLALLYAQTYPQHVKFLILRSVFLARQKDLQWLFGADGAARIFPEHYAEFIKDLPVSLDLPNIMQFYLAKFTQDNDLERAKFAKKWATWETKCATLEHNVEKEKFLNVLHDCLSFALMEAHYFVNNCFIEENQILNNMANLTNIPAIIVHGRQDTVCPFDNAYELYQAWPNGQAQLHIVAPAGHSMVEPLLANAVVNATNMVRTIF